MFLIVRQDQPHPEHVLVYEDPRATEPGFAEPVVEGVQLERPDCTAECAPGFQPPEGATVGQHPADPKHYKVFVSEKVRREGPYLAAAGEPRGPYRNWSEYLSQRKRAAA